MKTILIAVLTGCLCIPFSGQSFSQSGDRNAQNPMKVLIRCDDIGMCHTVNDAIKEVLDSGLPVSTSVMFACPWYQEGVEVLKQYPNVSVGIHLTLNSEWKNYR